MNSAIVATPNPELDLILDRTIDVPVNLVWRAWTTPEHLKKWFTPAPWSTVDCEIDLRPGGIFRTVMQSPEGEQFPNLGTYLDVVENQRLVWTNTLQPGFRPASSAIACPGVEFFFTAIITLQAEGTGTRYHAHVLHADPDSRKKHDDMGFRDGWSAALDQMIGVINSSMR